MNIFKESFPSDKITGYLRKNKIPSNNSIVYYSGMLILACLIIQTITGIMLLFYYKPSIDEAYYSITYLSESVPFGLLIRSLHYWCSNFLILLLFIYFFSYFFKRLYLRPGVFIWFSLIIIFFLILLMGYTGMILPWDDRAFFSLSIGLSGIKEIPIVGNITNELLKGSRLIGQNALSRMYALHTGLLPFVILIFIIFNVTLNIHYGAFIKNSSDKSIKNFFIKSVIYSLLLLCLLFIISVLIPKLSGNYFDILSPSEAPSNVKPEWYFMFIYQLLRMIPTILIFILLLIIFILFYAVPIIDRDINDNQKKLTINIIGAIFLLSIVLLTIKGYL